MDINIEEKVRKSREYFASGKTLDLEFRQNALRTLKKTIIKNKAEIYSALKADLNKSETESLMTEVSIVISELDYALKRLEQWVKPHKTSTSVIHFRASSAIYADPYGTVLIVAPWNYPFQLTFAPLIGAIAAGNTAVVKPSVYAKATSALINKIITETFAAEYVCCVEGGRAENTTLLQQKFDYIFFTGSTEVGKVVMRAAAENLTPVSLELGGKSPVIVDETANIEIAARRVAFGKCLNAGQTCVAPDYVLVNKKVKHKFLETLKTALVTFFNGNDYSDFPKIINEKHFLRLTDLIRCEKIYYGGKTNAEKLFIEPTVLSDCTFDSRCMSEEIFGPILPIIEYDKLDGLIALIKTMPKPLALYLFTESKANKEKVLKNLSFGGGCINDTVMHLVSDSLPFGGVGASGMGSYHGKKSFDTFTHYKSILDKDALPDIKARYRPYTKKKLDVINKLLK